MKNIRRQVILLFVIVFWILFVLGGYYYYHKPITPEMLAAPLRALLDILVAIFFTGFSGGLGRRLLKLEGLPPLTRSAVQYGLGAGIIGLAWFFAGVVGLYRFPLGAPLLAVGIYVLRRDILAWLSGLRSLRRTWDQSNGLEKLLALVSLALVFYQLFIALAPPLKWDALAYHLQLPRQYLAAGRLIFVPENPYWGHPQLVEMLYTLAMSIHRAETAAVLGWSAGVVFLLGLLGFTNTQLARIRRESVGASAGWMAVTAVLAGLTFRSLLAWSYTDLFSALFGLGALVLFFEWLEQRRPDLLMWCGLFCGLAIGTKWTSGILLLALISAAFIFRRSHPLAPRDWLFAGAAASLPVIPWLARNLLVTGSPLYPYFIGTQWFDAARLASANASSEPVNWWMHLLLPFSSTWAGVDSAAGFSTDLGPLLLLFALPGFLLYRRAPQAKTLAILLVFAALGMGVASLRLRHLMQTRLYFAALPALAVPCGWGWEWLQRQVVEGVRLRRIFSAVVLLVMGLAFWQDSYSLARVAPLGVTLGAQTSQEYLQRNLGFNIQAMQALENLPASARILMLWEPRGLYAPVNSQADLWIDRWRTDRREQGSAEAILQWWKQQGFTHVLVYQQGIELIRPQPGQAPTADWSVLQDLLNLLPAPESIGDAYWIYPLSKLRMDPSSCYSCTVPSGRIAPESDLAEKIL